MRRLAGHRAIAAFLLVTALLLAGCGGGASEAGEATRDNHTPTPSESDEAIVLTTARGGEFALNDVVGTPTMLWFWAPW